MNLPLGSLSDFRDLLRNILVPVLPHKFYECRACTPPVVTTAVYLCRVLKLDAIDNYGP